MTVIYFQLISNFLIFFLGNASFASEELASFCFAPSTNLTEAQKSLSFLLLPNEKTFLRTGENCFDVLTSTDRSKLLEKFLRKRYTLIAEQGIERTADSNLDLQSQHCQLELKTTKKKMVDTQDFQLGKKKKKAVVQSNEVTEVSVASILLGLGRPGSLELEGKALYVECRLMAAGNYQLDFFYNEKYKGQVSTNLNLKRNEIINIAQVTKELNEKSKSLGLPESEYKNVEGQETIDYELQIK